MTTSLVANRSADAVDSKLVKSSGRSDRKVKVRDDLGEVMQKVIAELENKEECKIQTKGQFASANQKLEGANQKIGEGARRSIGSVLHRYNASMKKGELRLRESF